MPESCGHCYLPSMEPPRDRQEFVIRFAFAAVFFGFVVALAGLRFVESFSWSAVAGWAAITAGISTFAAWHGDEAWRKLIGFFRWW